MDLRYVRLLINLHPAGLLVLMSGWSAEKLQAESRIKRRGRKALLKGPDLHAHNMPCEETFIWRVVAGHDTRREMITSPIRIDISLHKEGR